MTEETKKKLYGFFTKAKDTTIKAAKILAAKTSEAYTATKNYIENSIDDYKAKKEFERKIAVEEYSSFVKKVIDSIKDNEIKDFIKNLESSPTQLTFKEARKIKETFPIPREQRVLWAYYCVKTTRSGGLVITDKCVFLKTIVDVFTEKALKKEDRKVSELFYYPWVLMDSFSEKTINEEIVTSLDYENIHSFIYACDCMRKKQSERKKANIKHYSSREIIQNAEALIASGVVLQSDYIFARNNGFGNNPQAGFGLFAEQANNMADLSLLKNAKVVGGDNAKNGPDRLADGVFYQTKYYRTGARSVGATFDNKGAGNYRYWNADGTPMKLEVPKGQRYDAVRTMRNKIINGKVRTEINGKEYVVTDPNEAENIIVEGHYSMDQVVNMTKAGTIESLVYDVKTGAVVTSRIFGISFLINSYLCYRKTKDMKESLVSGLLAGGKVGALTLGTHVLISQLARTETFSQIMTKSVIKSGLVSVAVGFIVFSIPETYSFAMKKISSAQYTTNLAVLSASIIGGTAGAYAGGVLGGTIGAVAGAGAGSAPMAIATGTGGVIGGVTAGTLAGVGTSKLIDFIFEGDDKRLARLFNAISMVMFAEYLLDESEIDEFISKMNSTSERVFKKLFTDAYASNEQENVFRTFLELTFNEIVKKREKYTPDISLITTTIK